jgi:sulfoxide reductase heme-binding subunit YedZ
VSAAVPLGAIFDSRADWYLTRGTGVVALLLTSAIMVLGVLGPLRVSLAPLYPRFAIELIHRDLSLLAIVVVAVHVAFSVLDGFAPIALIDGLLPFHSPYRPLWLGLGALSFDLMLALVITSLVRRRLGHSAWRLVHWCAYAAWPLAVIHGIGTGTDAAQPWLIGLTFVCVLAVAVAVLARINTTQWSEESWRVAALATLVAVPVALGVFTYEGPLAPNWARRAGTPAKLIIHSTAVTAAGSP